MDKKSPKVHSSKRQFKRYHFQLAAKVFTSDEIRKIFSNQLKAIDFETYMFCWLLYVTGLRVSEALALKNKDLNWTTKTLSVKTLMRECHMRAIPLQSRTVHKLRDYVRIRRGLRKEDFLFDFNRKTAYNRVKKACNLAGIKDGRVHPHAFRHSFAYCLVKQGAPITTLHTLMGHRDLKSTYIYYKELLPDDPRAFMEKVKFGKPEQAPYSVAGFEQTVQ